jgi:redox-sensitive bicupin YhaK (pirin superfamily)
MKTVFHSEASRGHANHGWLNAKHSFSFASWQNPERVHFGALRVLNDDIVAPSMGFGKHPHDNMEIITIPLKGALKHQDSMGNSSVIEAGEVQVMSAGMGVQHSEVNAKHDEAINLFQIWIFPNKHNVTPRYDQIRYEEESMRNNFLQVVSPNPDDAGTWIQQQAWIHLSQMEEGKSLNYELKQKGNGVYILNVEGTFEIANQLLEKRDAIGVWETETIKIKANKTGRLLLIDVPMEF